MAKYTIELRDVCNMVSRVEVESWFKEYELSDYLTEDEIATINTSGKWSKDKLAKKIVDYYFMREIGFETIGLFMQKVKIKMKNIMESKLPLIYSAAIKYDPLVNVDVTTTTSRQVDDSANSNGLTISSDTPQGQINKEEILSGAYASSTQGGESTNTSKMIEASTVNTKGNSGVSATAQKMIEQYRQNIRAIDYEIIKELNSLFMGLY